MAVTPPAGIAWWQLVALMTVGSGAEPALAGVVRVRDAEEEPPEQVARLSSRDGLVRVERLDGRPLLVVGRDVQWVWLGEDDVPTVFHRFGSSWGFPGDDLVSRRSWDDWQGTDFTRPTGPVVPAVFLGRPARQVELAPPSHKPFPLTWVVDAETGLVLCQRNDGFGSVTEWVELEVGADLPDALFRWDGPTHEPPARDADHEEDMAERTAWLAQRGIGNLVVPVPVTLLLHEWADDGTFFASLTTGVDGSLARRPHAEGPWDHGQGRQAVEQWSDGDWDWLLTTEEPLSPAALRSVRDQLSHAT